MCYVVKYVTFFKYWWQNSDCTKNVQVVPKSLKNQRNSERKKRASNDEINIRVGRLIQSDNMSEVFVRDHFVDGMRVRVTAQSKSHFKSMDKSDSAPTNKSHFTWMDKSAVRCHTGSRCRWSPADEQMILEKNYQRKKHSKYITIQYPFSPNR